MRSLLIQANLVPDLGSARVERLMAHFSNADVLRKADPTAVAAALESTVSEAATVLQAVRERPAAAEEAKARRIGVELLTRIDARYPRRLVETIGPPGVLYTRGDRRAIEGPSVAIVGSRTPTNYGLRVARELGRDLAARGVHVVSGMARGIDGAAHRGALRAATDAGLDSKADAGGDARTDFRVGRTVAVLGCGVDICYPRSHDSLYEEILRRGLVVSEYPLGTPPLPRNFPRRNRIISGLADAVVIVEAALKSGSLITASLAADQGREVFAVPGPVTSDRSAGTHALLRHGATLMQDVDDLFESLAWRTPSLAAAADGASQKGPLPCLTAEEKNVLDRIGVEPVPTDRLAAETAYPAHRLAGILTMLELKDLIRDVGGGRVVSA